MNNSEKLPAGVLAAALEHGQVLDLDAVVAEILAEILAERNGR